MTVYWFLRGYDAGSSGLQIVEVGALESACVCEGMPVSVLSEAAQLPLLLGWAWWKHIFLTECIELFDGSKEQQAVPSLCT